MNAAVLAMLKDFGDVRGPGDEQNALKEIIQKIVLYGLYRQKFFDSAAFYGGRHYEFFMGSIGFRKTSISVSLVPTEVLHFNLTLRASRTN